MNYIDHHALEPGEKLPSERNLADTLKVSRTTVKEAISVLEANGIVHVKQGVGVFLAASNNEQFQKEMNEILMNQKGRFQEVLELRQAIEGDAAYYAAERMTDEQKERFTIIYQSLLAAEESGRDGIDEDLQFHMAIAEASNNTLIYEVMKIISNRIEVFLIQNRSETLVGTEQMIDVSTEHKSIYEAIINHEPEEAKAAMWNHLYSIKERHEHEWGEAD